MDQRIFFIAILLLNFLFLIFFSHKFLPLLSASLTNLNSSDFTSKLQEISQKLDKISQGIENLNSKLENTKIDLSPISKEISNLKNQIQKKSENSFQPKKEIENVEKDSEKIGTTEISKLEIKKEPKISISFPKEVFENQEFEVLFSAENFEQKSYDLKISVEYEGKVLSQIFNESENKWQSSNYYLKNIFATSSFSKVFKLKITSENLFGDFEILAKVRESETEKIVATTSEKIKVRQQIIRQTTQSPSKSEVSVPQPSETSTSQSSAEPKISLDFPKSVSSKSEFIVTLSLSNLPQSTFDVKIAVQRNATETTALTKICYPAEECLDPSRFQSSYNFLNEVVRTSNFTGKFKMIFDQAKIKDLSLPYNGVILARIRDSNTKKIIKELEFWSNIIITD